MMKVEGADRYNPALLPQLEAHVQQQVDQSTYNLEANLAILRLYQFNPAQTNIDVLAKILVKAIMQLPKPDFKICSHLVPVAVQSEPLIADVLAMGEALEQTAMNQFWAASAACKDVVDNVPGFLEAVRGYALHVAGAACRRVTKPALRAMLRADGPALEAIIAQQVANNQCTVEGDIIVLPTQEVSTSESNMARTVRIGAVAHLFPCAA